MYQKSGPHNKSSEVARSSGLPDATTHSVKQQALHSVDLSVF